jgi:hypothetical protein
MRSEYNLEVWVDNMEVNFSFSVYLQPWNIRISILFSSLSITKYRDLFIKSMTCDCSNMFEINQIMTFT